MPGWRQPRDDPRNDGYSQREQENSWIHLQVLESGNVFHDERGEVPAHQGISPIREQERTSTSEQREQSAFH